MIVQRELVFDDGGIVQLGKIAEVVMPCSGRVDALKLALDDGLLTCLLHDAASGTQAAGEYTNAALLGLTANGAVGRNLNGRFDVRRMVFGFHRGRARKVG